MTTKINIRSNGKILLAQTEANLPNNAQISIALIKNGKTNYYEMIKENDTIKPMKSTLIVNKNLKIDL